MPELKGEQLVGGIRVVETDSEWGKGVSITVTITNWGETKIAIVGRPELVWDDSGTESRTGYDKKGGHKSDESSQKLMPVPSSDTLQYPILLLAGESRQWHWELRGRSASDWLDLNWHKIRRGEWDNERFVIRVPTAQNPSHNDHDVGTPYSRGENDQEEGHRDQWAATFLKSW